MDVTIDTHTHVWRLGATEIEWDNPDTSILNRNYEVSDLRSLLDYADVDAAVLVQSSNSVEETGEFLQLADQHPWIAGVVGWVPLSSGIAVRDTLGEFGRMSAFKGVRHVLHNEASFDWILQPDVISGLQAVADSGLSFDVVPLTPSDLDDVETLASAVPALRLIVDHLGRPPLFADDTQWRSAIASLADHENVAIKMSLGLDVVRQLHEWPSAAVQPFIDHVIECFGPSRVMAASNWPVVLLGADYRSVWDYIRAALAGLDDVAQANVMGRSAARWYGLELPDSGDHGKSP